jgi:[protein]-arginine 3-hydroxylase / protease
MNAMIRRVASCSPEAFRRDWVKPGLPVVIEAVASSWRATARWTLPSLREGFGEVKVRVMRAPGGRVDASARSGTTSVSSTLGRYLDALGARVEDPGYLVTSWDDLPPALRADVPWPALCGEARWSRSTLWFGPEGIVSPMHFDVADNLYVVLRGRKRFTLVAPRESLKVKPGSPLSGQAQYAQVDPELEPGSYTRQVAELGPGDALYIPRFWWHHARGLELTLAVNFWWANGASSLLALAAEGWKRVRGFSR